MKKIDLFTFYYGYVTEPISPVFVCMWIFALRFYFCKQAMDT